MGSAKWWSIAYSVGTELFQSSNYRGEPIQIIDNINHIVKNDLQESIQPGSKLSIAAACFSIYAYQELKKQLEGIDELRFIFTSPTFVTANCQVKCNRIEK